MTLLSAAIRAQLQPYLHCKTFLVGFSGGLDSTVLLHVLAQVWHDLSICPNLRALHIHHGLSPNADLWAKHCQKYKSKL